MNFVGHEDVFEKLCQIVNLNRVGHAYLFSGKTGIGKKLVAMEFAKAMMCLEPIQGHACGKCEACLVFQNSSDFYLIEPDKNMIKVDAIRDLTEQVYLKPTLAKRKCFLIDQADLMNENAQNALLKILEEPPLYATLVLISANKQKLLKTILSRVTEVSFVALSGDEMKKILGAGFDETIIQYARGSVEKALKLADNNKIELAREMVNLFETKDFLTLTQKTEELKSDKELKTNISSLLELMMIVCFQKIRHHAELYTRYISIIEETNQRLFKNANLDLALDNMILEVCFN